MSRIALRAVAFACGLGIALPCWAQTTPVSQFPASQTVDWPSHVVGGAVRLYDINGNVIGGATHPLMVQCPDGTVNCFSGGGGAAGFTQTDEADYTAGVSALGPGGGLFQTSATSNALTNGQIGAFQVTATRALFTNLRNASGTEIGTASTPVQVSLANTAANSTALNITANAGTNLNTSALALETGGNLAQLVTDSGAPGATACATDTASCNFNQQLQRLAQRLTTINTTLGTPATAANQSTANTSLSSILSALGSPFQAGGSLTVQPGNTANTTPWLVTPKGVQDSGGTDMTDTTLHALKAEQIVNTGNAASLAHICGSSVTVNPSTATDTLAVEISGSTDIYICDISASSNGTNNFFLESAASTSCASTKTQIGNTWYTQQYWARIAANPYYRGVHTGAGKGLCVNTSAANALSVTIHYDQY